MRSNRKLFALLAAGALVSGLVAVASSAQAADGDLGKLKVNPLSGNQDTLMDFNTQTGAKCPAGTGSIQILMTGTGMTADNPGIVNGNTDYTQVQGANNNLAVPASRTFGAVFDEMGVSSLSGAYVLHLQCLDENLQVSGEFAITTTWTPTGSKTGTYVAASTASSTSTALNVGTPDPVLSGTPTSLTATVTPSTAAGSVQFKRNGVNLGAPVAVTGGTATLSNQVLPAGANALTAQFVPTDPDTDGASVSSAVSYAITGPVGLTGTARVGRVLGCSTLAVAGTTRSVLWFRNGVSTGVTAPSLAVPAGWYNTGIKCRVTTTKNGSSVVRDSATAKIALGSALVYSVRPKVLGTARVGRVLTCSPGTWRPAATSYRYQWFRGTRPIAGKIAAKYKTIRADKGKLLTCRVTAIRAGYASGVAKAPARRIS